MCYLRLLPLALAALLILRGQITHDGKYFLLGYLLLLFLFIGWIFQIFKAIDKRDFSKNTLILPATLAFLFFCQKTNIPLKFLFWTQKPALEQALTQPNSARVGGKKIGLLSPLQITEYKDATRFVVFDSELLGDKSAVGFAHCPTGCPSRGFENYYPRESGLKYSKITDDWYAVSLREAFMFQD